MPAERSIPNTLSEPTGRWCSCRIFSELSFSLAVAGPNVGLMTSALLALSLQMIALLDIPTPFGMYAVLQTL